MTFPGPLAEVAAGVMVLGASAGLGRAALPLAGIRGGGLASTAAGLAAGGLGVYACALAGLAYPVTGWAVVAAGAGCGMTVVGRALPVPAREADGAWERWTGGAVAAIALLALASALVPPVTYDAVAYHLVLPQQQALIHKATPTPWYLASSLPFLVHAGYLWAWLLGGDWRGAAVIDWAAGAAATAAVYRLARDAGLDRPGGLAAALIWQSIPIVVMESSAPLSDLEPCLYALLALGAFLRWRRGRQPRGLALAAVWCGLAGACKYVSGLVLLAMLPVVLAAAAPARTRVRRCLMMAALAGTAVAPVLLRNWLCDGAPLFPFLTGAPQGAKLVAWNRGISAVERTVWNGVSAPLRMAWEGRRFATRDLWQTGLVFAGLYLLPLFGWRAARGGNRGADRPLLWLAVTAAALWGFAFHGYWLVRYILVVAAICAVLWAGLAGGRRSVLAAVVGVLLASVLPHAPALAGPVRWFARAGWSTDAYLGLIPPYTWPYRSCLYLREQTPRDARILTVFEPQVFYARRRVFNSVMGDVSMIETLLAESRDLDGLLRRLARLKVGYLLVAEGVDAEHARLYLMNVNDRQLALLRILLADGAELLYRGPEAAHAVYRVRAPHVDKRGRGRIA